VVVNHFSDDGGNSSISIAKWQSLGFDAHSVVSTPLSCSSSTHQNYQLKAGSPRLTPARTCRRTSRHPWREPGQQGLAYDIGCYEAKAKVAAGSEATTMYPFSLSPQSLFRSVAHSHQLAHDVGAEYGVDLVFDGLGACRFLALAGSTERQSGVECRQT